MCNDRPRHFNSQNVMVPFFIVTYTYTCVPKGVVALMIIVININIIIFNMMIITMITTGARRGCGGAGGKPEFHSFHPVALDSRRYTSSKV